MGLLESHLYLLRDRLCRALRGWDDRALIGSRIVRSDEHFQPPSIVLRHARLRRR